MAQVTLDGMSREHGKGIDTKDLAGIREQPPRPEDPGEVRRGGDARSRSSRTSASIDYLQEFEGFVGKKRLSDEAEGVFALLRGKEVLQTVMDEHRETAE